MIDVYGIGNPLIDIVICVEDEDLEALGLDKGVMRLVDLEERKRILDRVREPEIEYSCGGSAPNTLIFLSSLGVKTAIAGKIGKDDFGERYLEHLPEENLTNCLVTGEGATGSSIILVTPDSERTMNTYLGANREFSPADVDLECVQKADYLYFTGYMWDTENQKNAVCKALDTCRDMGKIVAFDLADPFAVDRSREEFSTLIRENANMVTANREEGRLMFDAETAEEAATALSEICDLAVIKDGASGSVVKRRGGELERIPVRPVPTVDTTGAGDMYAAGFLYGLISGLSDRESGICASYLASRIVETFGAQFFPDTRKTVADEVHKGKWRFT